MSTKTLDGALDFIPEQKPASAGILSQVSAFFTTMREGLEMAHQYQVLTERGMQPAAAARAAVDAVEAQR